MLKWVKYISIKLIFKKLVKIETATILIVQEVTEA